MKNENETVGVLFPSAACVHKNVRLMLSLSAKFARMSTKAMSAFGFLSRRKFTSLKIYIWYKNQTPRNMPRKH